VSSSHNDVVISTFYDARELQAGQDFQSRFEQEIHSGTLLATMRCRRGRLDISYIGFRGGNASAGSRPSSKKPML